MWPHVVVLLPPRFNLLPDILKRQELVPVQEFRVGRLPQGERDLLFCEAFLQGIQSSFPEGDSAQQPYLRAGRVSGGQVRPRALFHQETCWWSQARVGRATEHIDVHLNSLRRLSGRELLASVTPETAPTASLRNNMRPNHNER